MHSALCWELGSNANPQLAPACVTSVDSGHEGTGGRWGVYGASYMHMCIMHLPTARSSYHVAVH